MDEARLAQWGEVIRALAELGGQHEFSHIYPNAEVIDASPADLPAGYIRVVGEDGTYTPAVVVPGLVISAGDYVNLLYIRGAEPIAFQHGAASSGGGVPGHVIADAATEYTQRRRLRFLGSAVVVSDNAGGNATDVTITGGKGWPFSRVITVDPTDTDADYSTIAAALAAASARTLVLLGLPATTYNEGNRSMDVGVGLAASSVISEYNILNTAYNTTVTLAGENWLDNISISHTRNANATLYGLYNNAQEEPIVLHNCTVRVSNTNTGANAHAHGIRSACEMVLRDCTVYAGCMPGKTSYGLHAVYETNYTLHNCSVYGQTYGVMLENGAYCHIYGGEVSGGTAGVYVGSGCTLHLYNVPTIGGGISGPGTVYGAWRDSSGNLYAGKTSAGINDISTDGTLSANSDNKLSTQKAIKTYVDSRASGLITTAHTHSKLVAEDGNPDPAVRCDADGRLIAGYGVSVTGPVVVSSGHISLPEISAPSAVSDRALIYAADTNNRTNLFARMSDQIRPVTTGQGARVFNNASISIPNATYTYLSFNSVRFDNDGIYDSNQPTRLTCRTPGIYYVVLHVRFAPNANGRRFAFIVLNQSSAFATTQHNNFGATAGVDLIVTSIWSLNAGDFINAMVYQDSGGNLNVEYWPPLSPEFAMVRIG